MGYERVVDGIAKFQALKFTFQGLKFPVKSLVLLVRRRIPQQFQALKLQNSGPEIWRFHPPPFHTPPFACLAWGFWAFCGAKRVTTLSFLLHSRHAKPWASCRCGLACCNGRRLRLLYIFHSMLLSFLHLFQLLFRTVPVCNPLWQVPGELGEDEGPEKSTPWTDAG